MKISYMSIPTSRYFPGVPFLGGRKLFYHNIYHNISLYNMIDFNLNPERAMNQLVF